MPDGRILICGNFLTYNGANSYFIARLLADAGLERLQQRRVKEVVADRPRRFAIVALRADQRRPRHQNFTTTGRPLTRTVLPFSSSSTSPLSSGRVAHWPRLRTASK